MGVAVRVRVSTEVRSWRSFSLAETPNFCSSSIINSPKSLKVNVSDSILWVPISMSILPVSRRFFMSFISLVVRRRLT